MLSAAGTEARQGAAPAAPGAQGELTEVHGWGRGPVAPFLGVLKRFGPAALPAVRDGLDPHGRFRSDLGARLGLIARA